MTLVMISLRELAEEFDRILVFYHTFAQVLDKRVGILKIVRNV